MASHRPTASSGSVPRSLLACARPALAMLLAAGVLHAAVPPAAAKSDKGKPGNGAAGSGGHVAPGQLKKAALNAAAAAPAALGKAPLAGATSAKKPAAHSEPKKPHPKQTQHTASRPTDSGSPVVAPAVATPAATAIVAAEPTAAAVPRAVATDTPQRATRSTTANRVRSVPRAQRSSGHARRSAPAPRAVGRSRTARAVATTTPVPTPSRADDAQPARSPLTRTVVRVLEVVPTPLRVALAALAGLGLILAATAAVQTIRRRRLERQRRKLVADVGVLQSALLPVLPERIGGAHVSAAYRPAEGLAAGGDFYDAFELPGGRTAVLIGDVAGHGREVVPLTALVRYNVRAYLEAGLSPRSTVHVASNVLAAHLGDLQVTIVVAIFDPGTGRLTYACAGHAPPLLLGSSAEAVTACSSPPIGAGAATGRRQTTVAFAPGAVACFHTDGLDEAPLAAGRLGRDGLAEELRAAGPRPDAGDLIARVVRRSKRRPDDMAACILTALPGGAAGWSLRLEEFEVDCAALSSGRAQRFLVACGVVGPRVAQALREAQTIVARAGTAVIEVRVGEALAEVRVARPPAITLPVGARTAESMAMASAG